MHLVRDEACLLAGLEWSPLCFGQIRPGSVCVTAPSDYDAGPLDAVVYAENKDYEVDYRGGRIRRLPGSAIRDYGEVLARQQGIVQCMENLNLYSAHEHTVYARYETESGDSVEAIAASVQHGAAPLSERTTLAEKRRRGGEAVYLVIGDSISTGAQFTPPGMQFMRRLAAHLESRSPGLAVRVVNKAVGGTCSDAGLSHLQSAMDEGVAPDLVSIGFGMNDQCGYTGPESVDTFIGHISAMLDFIASHWPAAQTVLIASMPPADGFFANSGHSDEYADALVKLGQDKNLPVADVRALFRHLKSKMGKRDAELIITDVNHPGPYGHGLYAASLQALFR